MEELIFDANEDWEKRVLCMDESCIGTIGPDGKCKECGKVYEGHLPESHDGNIVQTVKVEKETPAEPAGKDTDEDWDQRVLCSDGCCIGVIGEDGKCKECGKPG